MAITERVSNLGVKIEPRSEGTMTETGLLKTPNGTLMARHGTESGAREGADIDAQMAAADQQAAELEAMRAQQQTSTKKRARKKVAAQSVQQPAEDDSVSVTVNVEGFGGIPSQYDQVCIGNDNALLGLTTRSFIPQAATIIDGKPSQVLRLSTAPDRRFVYLGSQVVDKRGVTNLILIELKGA